eukprot:SM002804S10732  [mRNA]  locus=s2804:27:1499:- [translate_table: standard]
MATAAAGEVGSLGAQEWGFTLGEPSPANSAPFDPNAQVDHLESVLAIHRVFAQQIQQLERTVVAPTAATDAALRVESLTKWLQEQGLQAEGLRLKAGLPEGGAGVIAAHTLSTGELIAAVPTSAMMTTLTGLGSQEDVGLLCEHDAWLRAMPSLILSLHLLFEKVLLPLLPPPLFLHLSGPPWLATCPWQGRRSLGLISSSQ